jgi:putative PIN family toxin of toxin-antitoxin system
VRAVLDPNVLISAILSPAGSSANTIRAWLGGKLELVASPLVLQELTRAVAYAKLRERIERDEADQFVEWISDMATMVTDPSEPPTTASPDPGDDYLIALAESASAALVSGDGHLLGLSDRLPVFSPAEFLRLLETEQGPASR